MVNRKKGAVEISATGDIWATFQTRHDIDDGFGLSVLSSDRTCGVHFFDTFSRFGSVSATSLHLHKMCERDTQAGVR